MAKLIKRDNRLGPQGADPSSLPEDGPPGAESEGEGAGKRSAVIDKNSFEARSEAISIRDRAQAQAEEILAAAREEAEGIARAAKVEAEQTQAQAQAEGLAAGRQEGIEALMAAAARIAQQAEGLKDELAPQIVALSMAIARRILGRELEFQPETVVQIVKQALADKARQRREITLRVHPDDAALIRENRAALTEMLSRTKEIAIQEDPEVSRHGVVIETEAGIIDAQLDVQLAALERALHAVDEDPS